MTPTDPKSNPSYLPTVAQRIILTELPAIQAQQLQENEDMRDRLNAAAIADYTGQFMPWAQNYLGGHATLANMPTPPLARIVIQFQDPTSGPNGQGAYGTTPVFWPAVVLGTSPVCAPLPVPVLPPQQVPINNPVATVVAAPAGLVLASGTLVPAPDGSSWKFYQTPFGNILVKQ